MNYRILAIAIILVAFMLNGCDDKPTQPTKVNYTFVTIGTQDWMDKNLDVDHYRNGDPIPEVKDSAQWANVKTGAWCYYNNNPAMRAIYGKLYNWNAVNDPRGLAPDGWHIPTRDEWIELANCLGGNSIAGGKLKSIGTIENGDGLWESPNEGATNESGFSGMPGGERFIDESFAYMGWIGYWWSSTWHSTTEAYYSQLHCNHGGFGTYNRSKSCGFSIRCVKNKNI